MTLPMAVFNRILMGAYFVRCCDKCFTHIIHPGRCVVLHLHFVREYTKAQK